ncbi:MAG: CoA pyrophosphatase [Sandaracinaceae bacterium]
MSEVLFDLARLRASLAGSADADPEGPRAAVAALLRDGPEPEILFIQRAEHPSDPWSGHMAFPGGRLDPGDASLLHTVVRETREELGLDLVEHGELLGRLDDVPTHTTGLVVRPFVYRVGELPPLTPNYEVAGVHWTGVMPLMRGEVDTEYPLVWKGQPYRFPGYQVRDRVVWGLTYRMLQMLFDVARG